MPLAPDLLHDLAEFMPRSDILCLMHNSLTLSSNATAWAAVLTVVGVPLRGNAAFLNRFPQLRPLFPRREVARPVWGDRETARYNDSALFLRGKQVDERVYAARFSPRCRALACICVNWHVFVLHVESGACLWRSESEMVDYDMLAVNDAGAVLTSDSARLALRSAAPTLVYDTRSAVVHVHCADDWCACTTKSNEALFFDLRLRPTRRVALEPTPEHYRLHAPMFTSPVFRVHLPHLLYVRGPGLYRRDVRGGASRLLIHTYAPMEIDSVCDGRVLVRSGAAFYSILFA